MLNLHGYGWMIFGGVLMTSKLAVLSLLMAIFLGALGAKGKLSPRRFFRVMAEVYTTVIRGVPDLVLMLLIFYGGQISINELVSWFSRDTYIDINPFVAGVVTIGFIFGAYMTETFRGAVLEVPKNQLEAAYALGLSHSQVLWRILLPQMVRHALPGVGNNWLVLVKATAIVSVIGLEDVVRKASLAAGATRQPFTYYIVVAGYYLAITSISSVVLTRLERRFQRHLTGAHREF